MTNEEFLSDVHKALKPAINKAKQNRRAFEALSKPGYWEDHTARVNDPTARSYDALAPYIRPH